MELRRKPDTSSNIKLGRLGDHVEILSGFAFDSSRFAAEGEMPLIRIRDVVRGKTETYYSGPFEERFVVRKGDLLVGMDGDFNRETWSSEPALLNQRVCRISPADDHLDRRYLYHFLPQALMEIWHATPFATVKHLSVNAIREIALPLPPLEEQRRIAAILDKADELRTKRREALDHLDDLGQSIFHAMFGDPIINPMGWPSVALSQLGTLERGQSKHRPRNDPKLLGGPHPLIQTGDVANASGYVRKFSATYSEFGLKQSKKWPAGTLCITIAANIAKTAILKLDACFPDSVVGFVSDAATTEYVRTWFSFLQKTLEARAPESAQKNINLAILRTIQVPVPPLDMRRRFAERVATVEQLKIQHETHLSELEALSASLRHRAFSGQL